MRQKSNTAQVSTIKVKPMDKISEVLYTNSDLYCASGIGLVIGTLLGLTICITTFH